MMYSASCVYLLAVVWENFGPTRVLIRPHKRLLIYEGQEEAQS